MTPEEFSRRARALLLPGPHGHPAPAVMAAPLRGPPTLELGAFAWPMEAQPLSWRPTGAWPAHGGEGVVGLVLCVPRTSTLMPEQVLNRMCRPLLKLLRTWKLPANFLGRDAITIAGTEPIRFGLTAVPSAFLVDARIGHTVGLDWPALPVPSPQRPGDRKPSAPLRTLGASVPSDVEQVCAALVDAYAPLEPLHPEPVARALVADGPHPGRGVQTPMGEVRATRGGMVFGAFMASQDLTRDIAAARADGRPPEAAVQYALEQRGAFILGADAHHLVAALEAALP